MCIDLHVEYLLLWSDFNGKRNFQGRFFERYSDIKFNESSSSGSRVVPCGRKDKHDMMDLLMSWSLFAVLRTRVQIVQYFSSPKFVSTLLAVFVR